MKYSIRKQLIGIFMSVMTGAILLCLFINNIFLGEYYSINEQNNLRNAYYQIALANSSGKVLTNEFNLELLKICNKYNITVLLMDSDSRSIISSVSEAETNLLIKHLLDKVFKASTEDNVTIEETKDYAMQQTLDSRTQSEYIEMWGILENGNLFLIRTSVEGIDESATATNQFLMYVGLFALLCGGIIIFFVSKKLTDPITELTKISAKMKNLDFDIKYKVKGKNEISQLGQHMNEMSLTLEKTISELKNANHQLRMDIEKKEEIDTMRKDFISNVSHELKTPIALIQGYAEGLVDGIYDDKESYEYYCEVVIDEARKMNLIVGKLLTLNQLEFGNSKMNFTCIDLIHIIEEAIQSVDILIKQKDIRVIMENKEEVYVWVDEFQVEEVVMNYLSNAINYAEGEKKIHINVEKNVNGKVRVSVFNSGKPIPEQSIPYLWDKFYKVDKARTREYGGSGVGLSIVKAVMESLDQNYGVVNYPDGVAFWFELETM